MATTIKTPQFAHQRAVYDAHKDDPYYALFWEMGLGKTKLVLDVAAHLHDQCKIEGLLVVAPNSVYRNWLHEAEIHLAVPYMPLAYEKATSKRATGQQMLLLDRAFEALRLRVLCMSYDSAATEHGQIYAKDFLRGYDCMVVADESTAIKTHSAQRTKAVKRLGAMARYRWICTGTPVAQSPFDIHSQIAFLDPGYWNRFGMRSLGAFKSEFGEFVNRRLGNGRQFQELVRYRKLDRLQELITPISSRLLKEDSGVELPPKSYAVRAFRMTPEQTRAYASLSKEFQLELDSGATVDAALAITRTMRLQQITSGFVGAETVAPRVAEVTTEADYSAAWAQTRAADQCEAECEPVQEIVDLVPHWSNPRLDLLGEILDECAHKVIVWCRFRHDVDLIMTRFGDRCVRYDGAVTTQERRANIARFCNPGDPVQVLVANTHALSQGVTLTIAKTMVYYSNSFSLERRLQSEDRNHRIGQDSPVLIIDLAAENSIDTKIITALREKYDIAAIVTGDKIREWLAI